MKKTYQMILALAVMLLTAMNVDAAGKIYKADLAAGMFKAWDSNLPGANEVADPDPEPKNNGNFGCAYDLFKSVGAYGTIYGSSSVYYLWYADLTGTQTMTVTGTPGMNIRLMLNRVPFVEGGTGDADGGAYIEWIETLGEDGTFTFDFTQKAELVEAGYIHLNAMKVPSSGPEGVVTSIKLKGTVAPVTGILSLINNGEVESDDLSSFPVSYDGPNNNDTANDLPTIVDDGYVGKGLKVTSFPEATQTWHTQFFLKFDEALMPGDKWRLVFYAKADEKATITTSAQGQPRAWQSGISAIGNINVTDEWQRFEYSGTVTDDMGKNDGWLSMAFDLNNGEAKADGSGFEVSTKSNNFYFDEIEFGRDLGGTSALANVKAGFQMDVIRIDFGGDTNIKDLVKASADGKRIILPNECASATVNGEQTTLFSVEGRPDGYIYVFINEPYAENETDKVLVNFTNPTDGQCIKFTSGKWEGEAVPNIANMECVYTEGLGENYTYLSDTPIITSANPEDGSFNLPVDLKEFKVTFGTVAEASELKATLDGESLTVSPNEGFAKEFTFTRTADGDLTNGAHILTIDKVYPESRLSDDTFGTYELKLNFGPVVIDPNDQARDIVPASYFEECAGGGIPTGFNVYVGTEVRTAPNTYGSNACVKTYSEGGDFKRALYFRQDYVTFGEQEQYPLTLEGGKSYTFHFNGALWKDSGKYTKFELTKVDDGTVIEEAILENQNNVNGGQNIVVSGSAVYEKKIAIETSGNYLMKWTPCDKDGNPGSWNETLLANVYVNYVPNTAGVAEMQKVETALTNAKSTLEAFGKDRYEGDASTALQTAITKVENEKATYTSPSACQAAADELAAAVDALKKHYENCNTYDDLAKRLADVARINADRKFNVTEEYATIKTLAEKYHAVSQWVNKAEEGQAEDWQKEVTFDVLTDDAALNEAVAELNDIVYYAEKMFTIIEEGKVSECNNTTGIAALVERLRLGAETLKALGADSNDALVVAANNALTDDDALAENIKNDVKVRLYENLKDPNNDLFQQTVDETTLETVTANPIDLTVFVKNPNIYRTKGNSTAFTEENVPGWVTPEGFNKPGISPGWSNPVNGVESLPSDCMFEGYYRVFRVEQTIEGLPAGVYTVKIAAQEREFEDNDVTFAYVKTTDQDTVRVTIPKIGQSFPTVSNSGANIFKDITITDGKLTLGVNAGPADSGHSNIFINEVRIEMTGKAEGFDYTEAYNDAVATGIETVKTVDKANNGAIYNLAGQKVGNSFKGIVIMNGKKFVVK